MKRFWLVLAILFAAGQTMFGFALLGPLGPANGEPSSYQVQTISYDIGGDIGTPKNLGEGYRWNTRNVYYAMDANFLDYFGSNGVVAVDKAFAIMNSLSNVSSYSSNLSEWPLYSSRINHRAEALGLIDVKSVMLNALIEQMGLAEPERWTWALHARDPGPACPATARYVVIQRNFDPVTTHPSTYVNGTLYSYFILEFCTPPPVNVADAVEIAVDPTAPQLTAVASLGFGGGLFYTGLTRDDVGGLRYQWATNRMYVETVPTNTLLVVSNNFQTVVTSNLSALFLAGLTNNPAALQALFPGLIIVSNSSFFTNVITTNVVATIVTSPFLPAGSPGTVVLTPVVTTNVAQLFTYTFGNVITNSSFSQGFVIIQTITLTNGVTTTNNSAPIFTNVFNGDFFLIPSNQCGFSIVSTQFAGVIFITNTIASVTNTNATQTFTVNLITVVTNHVLLLSVPNCVPNSVGLREGIEKMNFFRRDFDSLLGQTWSPITNSYTLTAVSNNAPVVQTLFRAVNTPDILITAQDLAGGPGPPLIIDPVYARSISFNSNNVGLGLAGPGIIQPSVQITLNKVGPSFANGFNSNFFLPFNETSQSLVFQFGSFDGTTNDPIVYPDGTSIANLENNVFLQITTSGPLPNGNISKPYSFTMQASGAQPPPYAWSVPASSPALPNGLSLESATGIISGTPTATGIFDFTIQVADTAGRISQSNFTIEIDP